MNLSTRSLLHPACSQKPHILSVIITCLARAIDGNPSLHVCHQGNKHLVLFEEVDVATHWGVASVVKRGEQSTGRTP